MNAVDGPGAKSRPADPPRYRSGAPGFTLIELTIVVLLVGLLSALAISTYRGLIARARMTQAKIVLSHLYRTEAIHFSNNSAYTDNLALLDYDPVRYPYYQVSVVLDNGAQGYTGYATGVGAMAGDLWTITTDGIPTQDNSSPFRR